MLTSLKHSLEFDLPHYVWKWRWKIRISPKLTVGYDISVTWESKSSPITHETIQWVSESGARFIQVDRWEKSHPIKVIEHLISALVAAWISNAYITSDVSTAPRILGWKSWFTPMIGPWIEPLYSQLKEQKVFSIEDNISAPIIKKKQKFEYNWAVMLIEPSETFDVEIQTTHSDLVDVGAQALCIWDVMSHALEHASARPIARLQTHIKFWAFRALNSFPSTRLNAINPETYIMWLPWDDWDVIVWKMQEKYQEWRNEHLYHTLYSDFLWELAVFFPHGIKWKITLINTKHTTRVPLLHMLKNSEI